MIHRTTLLACLLLCLCGSIVSAQSKYPSTRYQEFSPAAQLNVSNNWSTSPPSIPDLGSSTSENGSMSPDSWSTTSSQMSKPIVEDSSRLDQQASVPTPSVPDTVSDSPYRPSSFARSAGSFPFENGMPGGLSATDDASKSDNTRYPLSGKKYEVAPASSIPKKSEFQTVETWYDSTVHEFPQTKDDPSEIFEPSLPNYRPDLGHRSQLPTFRPVDTEDVGQKFDFEDKKKEYPPMSEILATGRYFGSGSAIYLKSAFQANTAIATQGPGYGQSIPFDFDYEIAPQFRFGFESKYGPGIEFDYWQYDETSNPASFTSDGTVNGTTSTWMLGPSRWSRLRALNASERLDATHTVDVEVFGISFFKEIQFKIARLSGSFGFQYSSIAQSMNAILSSGGTEIGRLTSQSELNAWGPQFALEYFRPMGHTQLELFTSVGGSVLFGHRDHFVSNTVTGDFDRVNADEFVTTIDFLTGVQYKKMTAENRCFFARLGLNYQTWIGGGTAVDPQGDFGLCGFSFGVGYNR